MQMFQRNAHSASSRLETSDTLHNPALVANHSVSHHLQILDSLLPPCCCACVRHFEHNVRMSLHANVFAQSSGVIPCTVQVMRLTSIFIAALEDVPSLPTNMIQ